VADVILPVGVQHAEQAVAHATAVAPGNVQLDDVADPATAPLPADAAISNGENSILETKRGTPQA